MKFSDLNAGDRVAHCEHGMGSVTLKTAHYCRISYDGTWADDGTRVVSVLTPEDMEARPDCATVVRRTAT